MSEATVRILPHPDICPDGADIGVRMGESLLEAALRQGLEIEHACEMSCACTTCHVLVRRGLEVLTEPSEDEEDLLDKAWGLEPISRLSCQVYPEGQDMTVEIPKYTINQVSERH